MFKISSDSDESIENMKLDLLKAKYVHQKLNKQSSSGAKNSKHLTSITKPKRDDSNPKFSISKSNQRQILISSPSVGNKIYERSIDGSSTSDNYDQEDIMRMNLHADFILDKKRLPLYEDINESGGMSSMSQQKVTTSSQDAISDGYLKDNDDFISAYNPSTDILAQWRLRRKLSEAKYSVRTEHQKHSLRINELNSNLPKTILPSHRYPQKYDYDDVPVRDVPSNIQTTTISIPSDKILKTDSSCQCNFEEKQPIKDIKEKEIKLKSSRKSKRSVGIMVMESPLVKGTDGIDCGTQTLTPLIHESTEYSPSLAWSNHDQDYIDIAIQKTLQTQLFDRNCSSVMSTVTSINDSQPNVDTPLLDVMVNKNESSDQNVINGDNLLPWNDNFIVESDNEFNQDDVLIDLRKRRSLNLDKLKCLSIQIRNCTGKFPALELL